MSSAKKNNLTVPSEFKKYFWDVQFDELTIEKYPRFIAERILNYGDIESVKWLLSWAGKDFIRTLVLTSRNLNAKSKNFWQIMLT